ncbi:hypothetical protein GALL_64850 [mine drainage metagenome]|uniref:Uncharacterized protein n=1 Tax=mine drainage metagenome TaxID=410659 RepID=A0A1J5T7M0_9ZZZZ
MPFSFIILMNKEVLVVGIIPVEMATPFRLSIPVYLKVGSAANHTAAPLTTLDTTCKDAPLETAMDVHSGPWMENSALPEITAANAVLGDPAVCFTTFRPSFWK